MPSRRTGNETGASEPAAALGTIAPRDPAAVETRNASAGAESPRTGGLPSLVPVPLVFAFPILLVTAVLGYLLAQARLARHDKRLRHNRVGRQNLRFQ
ncbi:MAG: hypothetical protein HYX32_10930 [Actinobacteria bacterium]|nr:hypothetical protein [Actinomycetota bacterium]